MGKHPSEITEEERQRLQGKVDELITTFNEVLGVEHEAACVVHAKHDGETPCPGVFVMTNGQLPMKAAQAMIMQALILMEGAMIQHRMEMPTPQDTIN